MAITPPADDPYYQHEAYVGDVALPGVSYPRERPVGLHLRLHVAEEPYADPPPFLPIRQRRGRRVYVHARPYALVPEYRLTIALTTPGRPAGRVQDVQHRGWRRLDVGTAQAWLYPAEGTLVVWEGCCTGATGPGPIRGAIRPWRCCGTAWRAPCCATCSRGAPRRTW